MDFLGGKFSDILNRIIFIGIALVVLLFILRIIPYVALIGLVIFATVKIRSHFIKAAEHKNEVFNKTKNYTASETEATDSLDGEIIDVDYKEV